jgi:hypothetical protein
MENRKPTIDERLEALTQTLELMSHDTEAWRAEQKRLDARERRARRAIMQGIVAYLKALDEESHDGEA